MTLPSVKAVPRSLASLRRQCASDPRDRLPAAIDALRAAIDTPAAPDWLAARVAVLLGQYWTAEESAAEAEARLNDWLDVLDGFSQAVIQAACIAYLGSDDGTRRPSPAHIARLARAEVAACREALGTAHRRIAPPAKLVAPPQTESDREAEMARRRAFASDVMAKLGAKLREGRE